MILTTLIAAHSYQKCPVPLIKCQKCLKVGHDSITCELSVLPHPRQVTEFKANQETLNTLAISTKQ